jgi:hypothetical protein
MTDSTNIFDLPTDPLGGGNNIAITASEKVQVHEQPSQSGVTLDQTTINQIVNSLQQASMTGATQLSSRDISMDTTMHNTDKQVQPNYVPTENTIDYIQNNENSIDIINNYNNNKQKYDTLDNIYNEFQTPLLLIVLYFLFQLPIFKRLLFKYLPFLFSTDGNININGLLFSSVLFGSTFYSINNILLQFNKF